jgi:TolB protein
LGATDWEFILSLWAVNRGASRDLAKRWQRRIWALIFCAAQLFGVLSSTQAQEEVLPEVFLSGKVALSDRILLHYTGIQSDSAPGGAVLDTLDRVLIRDLTLSGFFDLRLPNLPPDTNRSKSAPTMTYLDGLIKEGGSYRADMRLKSSFRGQPFWERNYEFQFDKARAAGHRIAGDLIRQMIGEPPVMETRLVFCGKNDGGKDLYSTTFDGFDLRRLTHENASVFSPAWSPDGSRIAFTTFVKGQADIYIFNVANGEYRVFQNAPGVDSAPDWSPDGNSIAYSSSETDGNAEIYVRPANGGPAKRLTYSWAIETAPSWSPTGRELAFTSDRLGKPQVFIMDADGANQRRLTSFGEYNDSPAWSPRGDMIAYVRRNLEGFQIYLTDPRGEIHTQLTTITGDNMDPCWSPDGLRIAFASNRTGTFQIYTMDLFGRNVERVTQTPIACNNPTWSPVLEDTTNVVITSRK